MAGVRRVRDLFFFPFSFFEESVRDQMGCPFGC